MTHPNIDKYIKLTGSSDVYQVDIRDIIIVIPESHLTDKITCNLYP